MLGLLALLGAADTGAEPGREFERAIFGGGEEGDSAVSLMLSEREELLRFGR